jgi:hypothetical protein
MNAASTVIQIERAIDGGSVLFVVLGMLLAAACFIVGA